MTILTDNCHSKLPINKKPILNLACKHNRMLIDFQIRKSLPCEQLSKTCPNLIRGTIDLFSWVSCSTEGIIWHSSILFSRIVLQDTYMAERKILKEKGEGTR